MEGLPSCWPYFGLGLSSRALSHTSSLSGQEPPAPHCPQTKQLPSFQKMEPEPHISPLNNAQICSSAHSGVIFICIYTFEEHLLEAQMIANRARMLLLAHRWVRSPKRKGICNKILTFSCDIWSNVFKVKNSTAMWACFRASVEKEQRLWSAQAVH